MIHSGASKFNLREIGCYHIDDLLAQQYSEVLKTITLCAYGLY